MSIYALKTTTDEAFRTGLRHGRISAERDRDQYNKQRDISSLWTLAEKLAAQDCPYVQSQLSKAYQTGYRAGAVRALTYG